MYDFYDNLFSTLNPYFYIMLLQYNYTLVLFMSTYDSFSNCLRQLTAIDIRRVFSLAEYYRRFFEEFSSIASPSTKLTQMKVKFQWSDKCDKSFQTFKDCLTSTPILTLWEGLDGFIFILIHHV